MLLRRNASLNNDTPVDITLDQRSSDGSPLPIDNYSMHETNHNNIDGTSSSNAAVQADMLLDSVNNDSIDNECQSGSDGCSNEIECINEPLSHSNNGSIINDRIDNDSVNNAIDQPDADNTLASNAPNHLTPDPNNSRLKMHMQAITTIIHKDFLVIMLKDLTIISSPCTLC